MRQINTVMLQDGTVRHLATRKATHIRFNERWLTFCGLDIARHTTVVVDGDRDALGYDLCKTCAKVRRLNDADQVVPEANDAATRRAEAMGAPVQEVEARVFRVQGSTDTYTVTLPDDVHLAALCNCMAGKVHPEKQCKHQVTVEKILLAEMERYAAMGGSV